MNALDHYVEVLPAHSGWGAGGVEYMGNSQAECGGCGWTGPRRRWNERAARDGEAHLAQTSREPDDAGDSRG